jgi:hypothetical protein
MTPERQAEEEAQAREYARLLREALGETDWRTLNQEIIDRWSMSALRRVKERAWEIAYGDEVTPDAFAAIRAHVARHGSLTWYDGADLLAEVDRLRGVTKSNMRAFAEGENYATVRLREAVEGIEVDSDAGAWAWWLRAAVLGIFDGGEG